MSRATEEYSEFGVAQSRIWEPGTTCITIAANIAESAVLGVQGCFPDSILGFVPAEQADDAYFVKYLLDVHRERLTSSARGTTQDNLSLEKLLSHSFPIPDPIERSRIAGVLRSIDELIENNRQRVEQLEKAAHAIYREWFARFRYRGHEDVPLVDSPLGPIPEGWRLGALRELATEVRRSVKPSADTAELPYLPIDSIDPRSLTVWGHRPGTEAASSLRLFSKGDVVFGAMRAYFHKVCVSPFDGVTRSTCFVLRPEPHRYWYAALTLADASTVAYAAAHSSGSTIPYAKWEGVLSEMPVKLPTTSVSEAFAARVQPLLEMAQKLADQTQPLAALRDLLLPKLIAGQIDVSRLDLDAMTEAATA